MQQQLLGAGDTRQGELRQELIDKGAERKRERGRGEVWMEGKMAPRETRCNRREGGKGEAREQMGDVESG